MKSTRLLAKTALTVGLLGAALTLGIGTAASDAEAKGKPKIVRNQSSTRGQQVVRNQRPARDQKVVRNQRPARDQKIVRNQRPARDQKIVREHKDVRNREVVRDHEPRHYDKPVLVRDHARHRPAARRHYTHVVRRPWYTDVRRIHVHQNPYYFHAGFGVYFGGLFINVSLGDVVADGYVYRDPYCQLNFYTVDAYHHHLGRHHHYPALEVVPVEYCY